MGFSRKTATPSAGRPMEVSKTCVVICPIKIFLVCFVQPWEVKIPKKRFRSADKYRDGVLN
jgi:hypothetical protein